MEIINLIFNGENMRTVIILMAIFFSVKLSELRLEKKIDGLDRKIDENERKLDLKLDAKLKEGFANFHALLKANDFAHLNRTIKALTFTLEKNNVLNPEDKKYIDSHLDEK